MEWDEILKKHELWLKGKKGGERANFAGADLAEANLRGANFEGADLAGANLAGADFEGSNLWEANLWEANLRGANLWEANLRGANLVGANLAGANLWGTDLAGANLRGTDLAGANLRGTDLAGANLVGANLAGANLAGANLVGADFEGAHGIYNRSPEGEFIAWKKGAKQTLIKLLIPADARRSNATTSKCRCDKAKVLEIINLETGEAIDRAVSSWDPNFVYPVGEMVKVENFNEDRWKECAAGIHYFISRQEAIDYY